MASVFAKKTLFGAFASAILIALAAALLFSWGNGSDEAQAAHDAPTAATAGEDVGFDMLTAGNGATALGPIDACVSVPVGETAIPFDVFIDQVPAGRTISGYNYIINAKPAHTLAGIQVTAVSHAPSAEVIISPATGIILTLGSLPPAPLAGFAVADSDLGPAEAGPVPGVLNRYSVSTLGPDGVVSGDDAVPGLYPMILNGTAVFNAVGAEIWDDPPFSLTPDGANDGDAPTGDNNDGDALTDEDSLLHAFDAFGLIAVGVPCPLNADVKLVSQTINGPSQIPVSEEVPIQVVKEILNNGPQDPIDIDVSKELDAPDAPNATEIGVRVGVPPAYVAFYPNENINIKAGVNHYIKIDCQPR